MQAADKKIDSFYTKLMGLSKYCDLKTLIVEQNHKLYKIVRTSKYVKKGN